jgi:hypothetical protein
LDPFVIVEVNIFGYQLFELLEGRQRNMAQIFFFEMAEEVLGWGIVPAITRSGHGARDGILGSKDLICV